MKTTVPKSLFNEVADLQSATLLSLRRNSGIAVFLWILQIFAERLVLEHFQMAFFKMSKDAL